MPAPTLTTRRLVLRHWCDADLEPFAALNADPRVMEYFPGTLTREESDALAARIRSRLESCDFGFWAVEVPAIEPFIGFVGLSVPRCETHFTPCVEIGWRLAHAHWGRGYATEAAAAALAYGLNDLRLAEIVSFTAVVNRRSQLLCSASAWRARRGMTFSTRTCRRAIRSVPTCFTGYPRLLAGKPRRPFIQESLDRFPVVRRRMRQRLHRGCHLQQRIEAHVPAFHE
jgi:RimJ/RimL family protein N-acetyltransferase